MLYCRACYGHNFSPEGFGYGQRAGVVNSENGGERTTGVMMSESGGERIGYQPIAKGEGAKNILHNARINEPHTPIGMHLIDQCILIMQ